MQETICSHPHEHGYKWEGTNPQEVVLSAIRGDCQEAYIHMMDFGCIEYDPYTIVKTAIDCKSEHCLSVMVEFGDSHILASLSRNGTDVNYFRLIKCIEMDRQTFLDTTAKYGMYDRLNQYLSTEACLTQREYERLIDVALSYGQGDFWYSLHGRRFSAI